MRDAVEFLQAGVKLPDIRHIFRRSHHRTPPSPGDLIIHPDLAVTTTREDENTLRILWKHPAASVRIFASTTPAFDQSDTAEAQAIATVSGARGILLNNPGHQRRYYFELAFDTGERHTTAERSVHFSGTTNFRDIGGYPAEEGHTVRWGLVYRSAALARLTEADQRRLGQLNIQAVYDLRTVEETEHAPNRLPESRGITHRHFPPQINSSRWQQLRAVLVNRKNLSQLMQDLYQRVLIDQNPTMFGRVLQQLADPSNLPVVIHCAAGKDRTGIAVALLLSLLGVPEDIIVADYTLSNQSFEYYRANAQDMMRPLRRLGIKEHDLLPLLSADAVIMRQTLAHIRQNYGSVQAYLRERAGLTSETIQRIRLNLLAKQTAKTAKREDDGHFGSFQ